MLSYRHAFHAGNHADVLKHLCAVFLLRYLGQKETAFTYIDTHAGAGLYALTGEEARKSGDAQTGIARLWGRKDLPETVADYVAQVAELNPDGKLRRYPGSPWLAQQLLRPQDRLRLFELHPRDVQILANNFSGFQKRGRLLIAPDDGFANLKALLPPPSRRALVLIDPPYEVKTDYRAVVEAMKEALKRFPTGCYAIWYPVLQRIESRSFPEKLKRLPASSWINVTLSTRKPMPDGFGFSASGMFIVNPPYTMKAMLEKALPWLVENLAEDAGADFHMESMG